MKKIIVRVLIGFLIIVGVTLAVIMKDIPAAKKVDIDSVDIAHLPDGTYEGKYSFSRWNSEVRVTVENGVIVTIENLSEPMTPDVRGELADKIIKEQDTDVDVVTGATANSKIYLKSVEEALSHKQ